jgi:hypothetical protein
MATVAAQFEILPVVPSTKFLNDTTPFRQPSKVLDEGVENLIESVREAGVATFEAVDAYRVNGELIIADGWKRLLAARVGHDGGRPARLRWGHE